MTDYLKKPLDRQQLLDSLERFLPHEEPAATAGDGEPQAQSAEPSARGPAEPTDALPAWNCDAVAERFMGDWDFVMTLLDKFDHQAEADLKQLEEHVAQRDAEQTAMIAHRLKGAAASLSAVALAGAAARLETLGRQAGMDDAEACLAGLQHEWERFRLCRRDAAAAHGKT